MSTQRGDSTDSLQVASEGTPVNIFTRARRQASGHRGVLAIITVLGITAAVITPYIATSGVENFGKVITGQPVAQTTRVTEDTPAMETPIRSTGSQSSTDDSTSSTTEQPSQQTTVTINGQDVTVPANGTYTRTTDDAKGHTEIKVESNQTSTGSGSSSSSSSNSSVRLNIHSESRTSPED